MGTMRDNWGPVRPYGLVRVGRLIGNLGKKSFEVRVQAKSAAIRYMKINLESRNHNKDCGLGYSASTTQSGSWRPSRGKDQILRSPKALQAQHLLLKISGPPLKATSCKQTVVQVLAMLL